MTTATSESNCQIRHRILYRLTPSEDKQAFTQVRPSISESALTESAMRSFCHPTVSERRACGLHVTHIDFILSLWSRVRHVDQVEPQLYMPCVHLRLRTYQKSTLSYLLTCCWVAFDSPPSLPSILMSLRCCKRKL